MPTAALFPARRLAVALFVATVVAFGAFVGSAHAAVFENVGCGTRHFQKQFDVPSPTKLKLSVIHNPGRWGQMTIRNSAGTEVWSFRQSYAWISGYYELYSPELAAGSYTVDYWADNLAQLQNFCNATLSYSHGEED